MTEERTVELFDRLNAMSKEKRERLIKLLEGLMAYRQLTVEHARLHLVACSDLSKENAARYIEFGDNTVKPAKRELGDQLYTMYKDNAGDNLDTFREELGEQFDEFCEELNILFDDIADRFRTGVATVKGAVRSGVTTILGGRAVKS